MVIAANLPAILLLHYIWLMKFGGFILALMVLALSLSPCCGISDGCDDQTEQGSDSHNKCCTANCSPFFACGSCSGFSVNSQSTDLIVSLPFSSTPHQAHYVANLAHLSLPVWQPPQLCF